MFFILNNEKAVLAADKAFLDSVNVSSIYLLAERFRLGDIQLDETDHACRYGEQTHRFARRELQTTVGGAYLYEIEESVVAPGLPISGDTSPGEEDLPPIPEIEEETPDEVLEPVAPEETAPEKGDDTVHEDEAPLAAQADTSAVETASAPLSEEEDELLELLDLGEEEVSSSSPVPSEESASAPLSKTEPDDQPEPHKETETLRDDAPEEAPETPQSTAPAAGAAVAAAGAAFVAQETLSKEEAISEETPEDVLSLLEEEEKTPLSQTDEEIFELLDLEEPTPEHPETKQLTPSDEPHTPLASEEDDEPVSLSDESAAIDESLSLDTEESPADAPESFSPQTPFADYHNNAEIIGISHGEYIGFLRQFTEEALENEGALREKDLFLSRQNITSLKDASQLLHLPKITEILTEINDAPSDERHELIDHFFGMIDHIRHDLDTTPPSQAREASASSESAPSETVHPASDTPTDTAPSETVQTVLRDTLESVEPLPFEFSTKIASDELGLPEALVQEFVSDFVKQAEENVGVFQQAQSNGDIETIQKTAHLLKGAASNLRIDPLAETLETLQHNEDLTQVPDLLKRFLGQLKALTHFANPING